MVDKTLPCQHTANMRCHQDPKKYRCMEMIEKEFKACLHKATVRCSETRCPLPCENRRDCGHSCVRSCHPDDDPDHLKYMCEKPCTELNKNCTADHACKLKCHETCRNCEIEVKKKRSCGHQFQMKCMDDPEKIECKQKCKRVLECTHWCKRRCNEECEPCQEMVEKTIESCQHKVRVACGKPATRDLCQKKCQRNLPCGHPCTNTCAVSCTEECMVKVGLADSPCGHQVVLYCGEKNRGKNTNN